jgi:hypothetical protein
MNFLKWYCNIPIRFWRWLIKSGWWKEPVTEFMIVPFILFLIVGLFLDTLGVVLCLLIALIPSLFFFIPHAIYRQCLIDRKNKEAVE